MINTADEQAADEETTQLTANPGNNQQETETLQNATPTEEPSHKEPTFIGSAEVPWEELGHIQPGTESDQSAARKTPAIHQPLTVRPKRDRRRPSYLQDYVLN